MMSLPTELSVLDPRLASIRAEAARLLQEDIARLKPGIGIVRGNVPGFDIRAYAAAVRAGASSTALKFAATGNVTRDTPRVQSLITQLSFNRNNPRQAFEIATFQAENIGHPKANQIPISSMPDPIDILAPGLVPAVEPVKVVPSLVPGMNLVDAQYEEEQAQEQEYSTEDEF